MTLSLVRKLPLMPTSPTLAMLPSLISMITLTSSEDSLRTGYLGRASRYPSTP